ncbi:caspase family protein [Streptomyces mirabilis]|uniref:caspase family protein n=1 Tax=Streptomyces mirabilis TaxID=68239 RepID=UPI0021C1DC68|nr:caspase family protein [Streptomyces mirabilis]MCT9113783.1 caspase family protein [Streptomyces mirabilis]
MPDPWIPDGSASRAVLIGVPTYSSADLAEIPAVRDNLTALRKVLTGEHGQLPVDHCQVLGDQDQPLDKATLGSALTVARREATDLLLVYYAGHGLLDEDGLLHLTLADAEPDNVAYTAVPLEVVKRELSRARARARVLVLDCCFSGRAVAAMSTPDSLVAGQLEVTGTFTLTSTTATAPSHAPPGATYTAFTEALLGALRAPGPLTLDEIYAYVDRDLAGRGLPRPQRRSVNAASPWRQPQDRIPGPGGPPTPDGPTPREDLPAASQLPGAAGLRLHRDLLPT